MYHKWKKRAAAIMAGLMVIAGSVTVLASTQGSEDNPLVTLSYIKNVFTSSILRQTEGKIADAESKYEKRLASLITSYTNEMKSLTGSGDLSGTAVFSEVTLGGGKTLTAALGCELILRDGAAQGSAAGLLDSTAGSNLANGAALEKNHLYLATANGVTVSASGGEVTLLVRGSYTIQ